MTNILQFPKVDLRIPPEFIEPTNLARMSEEEQLSLLEQIRQRRMVAVTQYQTILAERKQVLRESYKQKYDTAIKRIASHIEKIDQSLAKVEEYLHKLRGTRLEAMEEVDEAGSNSDAFGSVGASSS